MEGDSAQYIFISGVLKDTDRCGYLNKGFFIVFFFYKISIS